MGNSEWRTPVLIGVGSLLLVLAAGYGLLRAVGLMSPDECISEEMATIPNLSGARFEVVYTNCDTVVKTEGVRVYISAAGNRKPWFSKLWNRRKVVFDYVPGSELVPPTIELSGDHRILISISEVSSVFVQKRRWRGISIDYRIGRIWYPVNERSE